MANIKLYSDGLLGKLGFTLKMVYVLLEYFKKTYIIITMSPSFTRIVLGATSISWILSFKNVSSYNAQNNLINMIYWIDTLDSVTSYTQSKNCVGGVQRVF